MNAERGDTRFCPECLKRGVVMDRDGFKCPSCGANGDLLALAELAKTFNFKTGEPIVSQLQTEIRQREAKQQVLPDQEVNWNALRSSIRFCAECQKPGVVMDDDGYRCPSCGDHGDLLAMAQLAKRFDFTTGTPIASRQLVAEFDRRQSEHEASQAAMAKPLLSRPLLLQVPGEIWYCFTNKNEVGPCDENEMKKMAMVGSLTHGTQVTVNGRHWQPLSSIPQLKMIVEVYRAKLPPKPLPTTCVFCAKKPRREAAGVCLYPMTGSTTTRTIPLPICSRCGQGMKTWTWCFFAIACLFALLATVVITIVIVEGPPKDGEAGMSTAEILLMFCPLGITLTALTLTAFLAPVYFGICEISLPYLGNQESTDPVQAQVQRVDKLEGDWRAGDYAKIPEIYNLFMAGYETQMKFSFFPGWSVELTNHE